MVKKNAIKKLTQRTVYHLVNSEEMRYKNTDKKDRKKTTNAFNAFVTEIFFKQHKKIATAILR